MKTTAQIEELHGCLTGDCPHQKQVECFMAIREQAQKDLIESASEGFEEWAKGEAEVTRKKERDTVPWLHIGSFSMYPRQWEFAKYSWQASRLGMMKENDGLKYELDFLSNVAKSNMELIHKNDRLQNEIKQLKEDLEWALKELDEYEAFFDEDEANQPKIKEIRKRHGLDKERV